MFERTRRARARKIVLLALLFVFCSQGTALAAVRGPYRAATVSCSAEACTGLDPYATGCADPFWTAQAQDISNGQLRVELEYSPLCQSFWTQAYWLDGIGRPLGANVVQRVGAKETVLSYWSDGGSWWIDTDQVWAASDASVFACAYAAQRGINAYPGICIQESVPYIPHAEFIV